MESKKINQLATEMSPAASDLTIIGDPITGVSKKITLEQISSLFAGSVSFYTNYASFPLVGSVDTIYCAKDTNKLYLWNGAYVEVFPSQALLDTYQLRSEKGSNNGYASLDSGGKVPSTQLPSYVDDIIEVANYAALPVTGETGKIYITLDNNKIYRWSGSVYVEIAANNAIWGSITGTLSNQTDLQNALNTKQNTITLTTTGTSGASTLVGSTLNIPNYSTDLSGYVPYTGATANVNLGTFDLTADVITGATGSFASNGGSNTFAINHSSGSGIALNITKGGNGEGLYINKTSGSGNAATIIGTLNATTLVKSGGTSSQFLKADGSVDSSAYITLASLSSSATGLTYTNTTGVFSLTAGYSIPTTASQANWNTAYNDSIVSAAVTGTTTKTLTLTQQDAGTITASWTDINTDAVTSVFGRTGAIIAVSGDYNTDLVTEGTTNLYFTDARSRAALSFTAGSGAYNSTSGVITIPTNNNQITNGSNYITLTSLSGSTGISYNNTTGAISSTITQYTDALARASISLTTTGTSGAATYNSTTGVFNIPQYTDQYVGTVTSVGLSSATSGVTIGSTPITTSGTITLAIATASGSQNGLLSSTDWTTFNNKASSVVGGYLPLSGGTMTGAINLLGSQFYESNGVFTLDANNSDIIGLNGLYFDDIAEGPYEGLNWYNTSTTWDSLWSASGILYYTPNRANNTSGTTYSVWTTQTLANPVTGGGSNNLLAYWNGNSSISSLDTSTYPSLTEISYVKGVTSAIQTQLNGKQSTLTNPVTGTGTNNYIAKFSSTGSTIGNSIIQDDGTYIAIGGAVLNSGILTIYNGGAFSTQYINTGAGGATWQIGATNNDYGAGGGKFVFTYGTSSLNSILTLTQATKNVSIGSVSDVSRLYVEGAHTSGRGIITANSTDVAYLHLTSSSATTTEVGVRYAKDNVEKWVLGMVAGASATDYTFRLLGSGLASNVFNVNLTTGVTTYNYGIIGTSALFSQSANSYILKLLNNSGYPAILDLSTTTATSTARNWALFTNGTNWGDLEFKVSAANGGDPYTSGSVALRFASTSAATFSSSVTATSFVKTGGTASQYLMADGSVTVGGGGGSQWTTVGDSIYFNGKTSIGTTQFATNSKLLVGNYINLGTSAIAQFNGFIRVVDQLILHNSGNTALESFIQCQAANSLTTNGNFSIGTEATTTKLSIYQGSASTSTIDSGITLGNGNAATGNMIGVKFGTYGDAAGSLAYAKQFIAGWRSADGAGFGDLILGNYKGEDAFGVARYEDTALRIKQNGNVIIGTYTTTPNGYTLQVNGNISASSGFFDTSDSRLKILVNDYQQPKGIENVAARMYVKNSRKELGYFAQDLQEILPSAVNEGEDGFLTLSYNQVHTAKIAYLEKEVAELKELIKTLL